jgi:hypothetical protein
MQDAVTLLGAISAPLLFPSRFAYLPTGPKPKSTLMQRRCCLSHWHYHGVTVLPYDPERLAMSQRPCQCDK